MGTEASTGISRNRSRPGRAGSFPMVLTASPCMAVLLMSLLACSPEPLSTDGSIAMVARTNNPWMTEFASSQPGLQLEQKTGSDYWLQRYNQDISSGNSADLYTAEWNHEVFALVRANRSADLARLWKRTETAARGQQWLSRLHSGPARGFVPTAAYIWGLFVRTRQTGTSTGSATAVDLLQGIKSIVELEAVFASRMAEGQTPIALGNSTGWPGAAWFTMLDLRMNGPEAVWERYEGKRPFDDDGAKAVFRKLAEWRDKGWFGPDASRGTLMDMIRSVESGSAYCTLMGSYGLDRFSNTRAISFMPFPTITNTAKAEIASLSGFFIPAETSKGEAVLALVDAFIMAGSPGHVDDSYRVPLSRLLKPVSGKETGTSMELTGIRQIQAQAMNDASALVPAFDRAMTPQLMQETTRLWAAFFSPAAPEADTFARNLQTVVSRFTR